MNKRVAVFQKPDQQEAFKTWNDLAPNSDGNITIAHNPALFSFFSDFLHLSPYYLILYAKETPVGLLPLVKTGNSYISIPHFSYGGIHWIDRPDNVPFDEAGLIQAVVDSIQIKKLIPGFYQVQFPPSVTLQKTTSMPVEVRSDRQFFSHVDQSKVVHLVQLKKTEEEQLNTFSSNLRRKINKASKNRLQIKSGKLELLDDFTRVYNENMHRIGSPTLGRKFFGALLQVPGANAKLFVVYLKNKPVGGSFAMWYDGYYENTWFSTLAEFNHLYPSYLLHDEMIRDAISKKMHTYSMGRSSKGSGVQWFKLQWPVEEKALFFNSNIKPGFSLKNQKWLTKIWKRLPAVVVNSLGPVVAKRIY